MEINLKNELKSGLFYSALTKYSGIIISLIVSAVLARLLTPADFGIVAISMVFIVFISMLSDLGFAPAIVQNKSLTVDDTNNIFSFTIWMAFIISVLFFFFSGIIAGYYQNKSLVAIFRILTINVFFSTANIVPNALLLKSRIFKFIAVRTLIIQLIGGVISVIAALKGAGLYALLINPLIYSLVIFIIDSSKSKVRFKLRIQLASIRKIIAFSSYQLLFNIVNYFMRNADTLLIGKFLGMNSLGYYDKSYRLMMLPISSITNVLTPVIHPIFSDIQNDKKRIYRANQKIVKFLAYIGFPFSVLLFFLSKEVILVIYGHQWLKAIPVFSILSLSACFQIIGCSSGSFFQCLNATKYLFLCGMINSFIVISFLLAGLFYFKTIEGVALSFLASGFIGFFFTFYYLITKAFGESLLAFLKVLISPLLFSIVLFILLSTVNHLIISYNVFVTGSVKLSIFASTFYLYIRYIENVDFKNLYSNTFKS